MKAKKIIPITAQCSVFTESEVISLINKRTPTADIAAGIHSAIAKRVFALARRWAKDGVAAHLSPAAFAGRHGDRHQATHG